MLKAVAGLAGTLLLLLGILWTARCDGAKALLWGPGEIDGRGTARLFRWAAALFALVLLLALLVQIPALAAIDHGIAWDFKETGSRSLSHVLHAISNAGGDDMLKYWLPVLAVGLLLMGRARSLRFVTFTMLGTISTEWLFKASVARERPDGRHWDSYPSGHTLEATILAGLLVLLLLPYCRRPWQRALLWTAGALWPLLMAVSRVYVGAHFPADTVGSMLLGTSWLCLCLAVLRRRVVRLAAE